MLLERARRILASGEGKFAPSPPPALLDSITDELLVVASDTVEAVATQAPTKPSGKAKYRLLAWLVADARGADTLLEKALAETVDKRLDRQATAVRAATADAVQLAESARAAARSAAASDTALQARPWRQLSQALMQTSSRLLSGGRAAKCTSASTSWTRCFPGPMATSRSHPTCPSSAPRSTS